MGPELGQPRMGAGGEAEPFAAHARSGENPAPAIAGNRRGVGPRTASGSRWAAREADPGPGAGGEVGEGKGFSDAPARRTAPRISCVSTLRGQPAWRSARHPKDEGKAFGKIHAS
jgi:hypothetical protein